MISIFHEACHTCSNIVTTRYSTSFASAIKLLHKDLRTPVRDIYGFVRFADEIVDSFHGYDKDALLTKFEADTWLAIQDGISLNPILHSFQYAVNKYNIPHHLISAFLHSMRMDLHKSTYDNNEELDGYIYGSAEVVGLMCLCVFCEGDTERYESLKEPARRLGAAFQKINFLRDLKEDCNILNRSYFPGVDFTHFDNAVKLVIEKGMEEDFDAGLCGIRRLPWKARLGVYTAYRYYYRLFTKIRAMQPAGVLQKRVRVPNLQKLGIMLQANVYNKLDLI